MTVRAVLGGTLALAIVLAPQPVLAQPATPAPSALPAQPGVQTEARDDDEPVGRTQTNPPTGALSEQSPGRVGTAEVAADPATGAAAAAAATSTGATSTGESPKRAMPDYDGRGAPKTTAGDVALWIPRILLSPLYLVSEYVVRRPLGWFITTAEQNQWPSAIRNLFLFGPEKKAGIVPTAFLDFGIRPSFGIYAFWDDLLHPGNHLRLHASTFGRDWLQGAIADKIPIGKDASFDLRLEGSHRPDNIFHGIGPRSLQDDRVRFGMDRVQARPVFEIQWWKGSRLTTEAGVRYVDFRNDRCCADPSLETTIRDGRMPTPPGYRDGYSALFQRGELTVDTRDERPADQSGLRLELEAEHASNVRRSNGNWLRYGATVGGILDIKNNRTVSLSVSTLFVDPISRGAEIPFTEQIVLGGSGPMRGYLYGRLVDRSAAIATLKYKWPIWIFLDGTIHLAAGNVFGPQLEDFHTKLLRLSGAMGVESIGSADHTFELLAGFGTETFDQGATVNSLRVVFGTNRGF